MYSDLRLTFFTRRQMWWPWMERLYMEAQESTRSTTATERAASGPMAAWLQPHPQSRGHLPGLPVATASGPQEQGVALGSLGCGERSPRASSQASGPPVTQDPKGWEFGCEGHRPGSKRKGQPPRV